MINALGEQIRQEVDNGAFVPWCTTIPDEKY
jgi:hypothetical protein